MTVNKYSEQFFGRKVVDFSMGDSIAAGSDVVYRLYQEYESEESQQELLNDFLGKIDRSTLDALLIGPWSESFEVSPQPYLDTLIARRAELPALKALFVGDMTYEDCEISWIIQTRYNDLLDAFPELHELRVRGSTQLQLTPFTHNVLQSLSIETGGLPSAIVNAIAASELPMLRHLELWLGDDNYGFDGDIQTYAALLNAIKPERLHTLALRNATISDGLATHIAQQPWLGQLHTLDLSMGTIGDVGAQALFESPHLAGLEKLDVSHHYISPQWQAKLKTLPVELVMNDPQDADETDGERYVEVSE
ncbi:MAG: STM4015 family protein [Pseudomonadota bacterium]|nr:STM4015 family protein [Pseudomonadota bacterium]